MERKYREAVPWTHPRHTEFRELVSITADAANIVAEVSQAFLGSAEIALLHQAYDPGVRIQLSVSSSNKYTRFKFPNCLRLVAEVHRILDKYDCQEIGNPLAGHGTMEITIPRLGRVEETVYFGERNGIRSPDLLETES